MKRVIRISVIKHAKADLLMAVSPEDMRGLVLHGRSLDEIEHRLPGTIRDLLEADGVGVDTVELRPAAGAGVRGFAVLGSFVANVGLVR
jgi:hypothetical protein